LASPGSTPHPGTTHEIKSATLPLVALLLKSPDLQALERELGERLADVPDFFDGDALLVDLSRLEPEGAEIDFRGLLETLGRYRLRAVAVRGGTEHQQLGAASAGLFAAADARIARTVPDLPAAPSAAQPSRATQAPSQPIDAARPAMVVDKPLRGGQQVYAKGRDLVVLAMVNPGAEVIADGHIHVYAPLRGRAIAGASGDTQARIFALAMEPELISIAGVYRTGETPLPDNVRGKTAQVRLLADLAGDRLMVEPLSGPGSRSR
jgi:septum site-determining protein MinC